MSRSIAEMEAMMQDMCNQLAERVGREAWAANPRFYEDMAAQLLWGLLTPEERMAASRRDVEVRRELWRRKHGRMPTTDELRAEIRAEIDAEGLA
jgi:hypothetical protein